MKALFSCALVVVISWYAIVGSIRHEIDALEAHLAARNPEIERARGAAVALPALEREIEQLETNLETFANAQGGGAPNSLMADLQVAAAAAQLRVTGLKPRADLGQKGRAERIVELSIEGAYHDVGRFLARLASLPRVLNTPDFSLRAHPGGRGPNPIVVGSIGVVDTGVSLNRLGPDEPIAYDSGGRRDPFESAVRRTSSPSPISAVSRNHGLASVSLADVVVKGIAGDRHRKLAILETTTRQSFIVHPLDQLLDSTIQDIDSVGVLFVRRDGQNPPAHIHKPVRPPIGEPR